MDGGVRVWEGEVGVVYRDQWLVVVNKPSGLLVHPSAEASDRDTCLSVVRRQVGAFVYPLHRLDRGTSGLLMLGLDRETARVMHTQFAERTIAKRYLAVVRGWVTEPVTYDRPIRRDRGSTGGEALTHVRPLATGRLDIPVGRYPEARYSLVEAEPHTGRRHQVRRHLANNDHPIVGDTVHGDGRHNRLFRGLFGIHHLLLHASRLAFRHPFEEREISLSAPLPADFLDVVDRFGWREAAAAALDPGTRDRSGPVGS